MKKKKKGKLFDAFAILIAFVSLFFNILLLYSIMNTPEVKPEPTTPDVNKHTYTKKELGVTQLLKLITIIPCSDKAKD